MKPATTNCATAASIFALLSLPSDRSLTHHPLSHPDFSLASGYIQRTIGNSRVHAVDWDGNPGIETVLREDGPRSKAFWRETREWIADHPELDLETYGTRVCELLMQHFGPYDEETSKALGQRRELERQRAHISDDLDCACPPSLRHAAHEYLGMTITHPITTRLPAYFLMSGIHAQLHDFSGSRPQLSDDLSLSETPLSSSETVLRESMALTSDSTVPTPKLLTTFAERIVREAHPLEKKLHEIEQALWRVTLPPIPCEGSPADPDIIPYGRLICRHRAVIAALALADAGFDVELISGARESSGSSFAHLFVYSKEVGVLEASVEGPEFWMKVKVTSGDPALPVLEMEDGSRYRFYHRTPLRLR
jgi:hypothetical protein